jgi:hypothetical protein
MAETRRKFDQDFRDGAVRIVLETGKGPSRNNLYRLGFGLFVGCFFGWIV